ncbi:MAG: gliding motility lipoprotein GldH [Bacteroidetes bacterium]|nr:gliding motility lipoprotein GldH [Bacteroidota bacterium]
MKKLTMLCLTFLLLIMSCNPNRIFEKHEEVKQSCWSREDKKTYTVDITDTGSSYNLVIAVRHAQGFGYRDLTVSVRRTAPDGTEVEKEYDLPIIDDNDEYLGDGAGDIWDREVTADSGITFPAPGTYKFEITHAMKDDPLLLVMEVGLILERQEL